MPSSCGLVAHQMLVAAPCSTVFRPCAGSRIGLPFSSTRPAARRTSGEIYFERPVSTMLPGCKEKARTPSALPRSSSVSAKRMLAVFDWFQPVLFDQQANGIGKAIAWIREHYARSFTVEELATSNNMSGSGLHHQFKAITTMGPLQYQKHLRLQEASRLMLSGSMDATTAALEVGYESPSQFSREYRRLFGLPPLQDIKAVRKSSAAGAFEKS